MLVKINLKLFELLNFYNIWKINLSEFFQLKFNIFIL